MPKRLSKDSDDFFVNARRVVEQAIGEKMDGTPLESSEDSRKPVKKRRSQTGKTPSASDVSRVMSAMGRKGGKVGGKRRLTTMTPEQRREVAVKAATARWGKPRG